MKNAGTAVIKPSLAGGEILWPVILLCYGMLISWCKREFLASVKDKSGNEGPGLEEEVCAVK